MKLPAPRWLRAAGRLLALAALLTASAFRLPTLPPGDTLPTRLVRGLATFYATTLPEKAYLHLDRPLYGAGETIWFEAYVVEADTHRPDTLSKVLYVELLHGSRLLAQRTLHLQGGRAPGDLALPDSLAPGTYQLRAYTTWMRNAGPVYFFTRSLSIIGPGGAVPAPTAPAGRPDVQFFPEGGYLVAGLPAEVGFKAVGTDGRGVAVRGTVLDGQRQPVASFESRHAGMGSFGFTPVAGQAYRAVVPLPGGGTAEYALPAVQPGGYALHAEETATEFVVTLRQRGEAAGPALLLAQVRGQAVFAARPTVPEATQAVAHLPKSKFPAGVAQLTLFDAQGAARCERLLFVPNPPGVRLTLTPDQPSYGPRQQVRLRLAATNAAGQPVASSFSVAVGALPPAGTEATAPTIVSHLLLGSDLAGPVEDPGYYFPDVPTPATQQALHDLLLTQGWRRFVWKEVLAGQLPPREFLPEPGLSVAGQLLAATGQPVAGHLVTYRQAAPTREAQTLTDATGHFRFRGISGFDTTAFVLHAPPAKGDPAFAIRLRGVPPTALLPAGPVAGTPAELARYARLGHTQPQPAAGTPGRSIALGQVQVWGRRLPTNEPIRSYTVGNATVLHVPDAARTGDSRTVLQYLQGRVAGVAVSGNSINIRQQAVFQGATTGGFALLEPLYLVDGAIVPAETFKAFFVRDIETIDVLKPSDAGLFGIQGGAGVIALYTRRNSDPLPTDEYPATGPGGLPGQLPGYYQAREFYAPRYPAASSAPDPRGATLYWLPAVQTDASGQAQLSFYTADLPGPQQAVAEGISPAGLPLRGTTRFEVRP